MTRKLYFPDEEDVRTSTLCGCYHCCTILKPEEVEIEIGDDYDWISCPHCGIDSILCNSFGVEITKQGLIDIHKVKFNMTYNLVK
jgi:hypothetical protein